MAKVLIIDDDKGMCAMLTDCLGADGHEPFSVNRLQQGMEVLETSPVDVVLLDVRLPDGNGLDYIGRFAAAPSKPEIIIITGQGEADGAEKAVLSGAWSYVEKPYVVRELPLQVARALQYRKEKLKVTSVPVAFKKRGDCRKQ